MSDRIAIFGSGGHANVVAAAALANGYRDICFISEGERTGESASFRSVPETAESLAQLQSDSFSFFVGVGKNTIRTSIARRHASFPFVQLVHPRGYLDPSSSLSPGSLCAVGAIISVQCTIGAHVIVNTGATVDHDCVLANGCHICPGAHLAGGVRVGENTLIGTGAVVIPGITIGNDAVIGAGTVVIRDVPAGSRVAGNPARSISR